MTRPFEESLLAHTCLAMVFVILATPLAEAQNNPNMTLPPDPGPEQLHETGWDPYNFELQFDLKTNQSNGYLFMGTYFTNNDFVSLNLVDGYKLNYLTLCYGFMNSVFVNELNTPLNDDQYHYIKFKFTSRWKGWSRATIWVDEVEVAKLEQNSACDPVDKLVVVGGYDVAHRKVTDIGTTPGFLTGCIKCLKLSTIIIKPKCIE